MNTEFTEGKKVRLTPVGREWTRGKWFAMTATVVDTPFTNTVRVQNGDRLLVSPFEFWEPIPESEVEK